MMIEEPTYLAYKCRIVRSNIPLAELQVKHIGLVMHRSDPSSPNWDVVLYPYLQGEDDAAPAIVESQCVKFPDIPVTTRCSMISFVAKGASMTLEPLGDLE